MKNSFKRAAAALMSAVMLFSQFPEYRPVEKAKAVVPDNAVYEDAVINEITLGTTEIDCSYTSYWFSFVPENNGIYEISSDSENVNPSIALYDDENNCIETAEDISGDNNDFFMTDYLTAGKTYYYHVVNFDAQNGEKYEVLLEKKTVTDLETGKINYVNREGNGKRWFKFAAEKDVAYRVVADAKFLTHSTYDWEDDVNTGTKIGTYTVPYTVQIAHVGPYEEETEILVCVDESSLEEEAENFMLAMVEDYEDPEYGIEDVETQSRSYCNLSVQTGDTIDLKVQTLEGQKIAYSLWVNSKGEIIKKGGVDNYSDGYSTTITSVNDIYAYAFDKYFTYDCMHYQFTVDNNLSVKAKGSNMIFVQPTENSIDLEVTATAIDTSKITYKWYYYDEDYQPVYIAEVAKVKVEIPFAESYFCLVEDGYGDYDTITFTVVSDITVLNENEKAEFSNGIGYNEKWFSFTPASDGDYRFVVEGSTTMGIYGDLFGKEGTQLSLYSVSDSSENTYHANLTGGETYYFRCGTNYDGDYSVEAFKKVDNKLFVHPADKDATVNKASYQLKLGSKKNLKVVATATDTEGITYQWYKYRYGYYNIIPGATADTYPVRIEGEATYKCVVTDKYKNTAYAEFTLTIDNELDAWAKGSDHKQLVVVNADPSAEELTFEVEATVATGDIYYSWKTNKYSWLNSYESSYTAEAPFNEEYSCEVTDVYYNKVVVSFIVTNEVVNLTTGEEKTGTLESGKSQWFSFTPSESGNYRFLTRCEDDVVDDVEGSLIGDEGVVSPSDGISAHLSNGQFFVNFELEKGKTYYYKLTNESASSTEYGVTAMFTKENHLELTLVTASYRRVKYGSDIDFEVKATADDLEGIRYEWYNEDVLIEGKNTAKISMKATFDGSLKCIAYDRYGNKDDVWMSVGIDNEFKAWAVGTDESQNKNIILAPGTESLEFEVAYTGLNIDGVTVTWYNENDVEMGLTGKKITVNAPFGSKYYAIVADAFGNSNPVNFNLVSEFTEIKVGDTKNGTATRAKDAWYIFTPEEDGVYVFSMNDDDTYAYNHIFTADSSEVKFKNVFDNYELKAGVSYFIQVYTYSDNPAAFTLKLMQKKENHLAAWGKGSTDKSSWIDYAYTAATNSITLEIEYSADDMTGIECIWQDHSIGRELGRGKSITLTAPFYSCICFVKDNHGNKVQVDFWPNLVEGTISVGEKKNINITEYYRTHMYSFTPGKTGIFRVFSTGDVITDVTIKILKDGYISDYGMAFGNENDKNFDFDLKVDDPDAVYYLDFGCVNDNTGNYVATIEEDTTAGDPHKLSLQLVSGTKKPITVSGIEDGKTYSGEIAFDVSCEDACMILMSEDGGASYHRLAGYMDGENANTYHFGIRIKSDVKIVVVKVGDFTLDGSVDSADALQMLRYDVKKLTDVSEVQLIAGNVGGNDQVINSADALLVLRHDVGKADFQW